MKPRSILYLYLHIVGFLQILIRCGLAGGGCEDITTAYSKAASLLCAAALCAAPPPTTGGAPLGRSEELWLQLLSTKATIPQWFFFLS